MQIEKYSFGTGDRFAQQGRAQLGAIMKANEAGVELVPVWNKSNREHLITGSSPSETRQEADEAVRALGWQGSYYVDADHVNRETVDRFMDHADFFTLDVAEFIGAAAAEREVAEFLELAGPFRGSLKIPGIDEPFNVDREQLMGVASRYLGAVKEAAAIYRHIADARGEESFVPEISMDEVDEPQAPEDLFFILLMTKHFGVPVQTIAPKFTGRFNKGVDYTGDLEQFSMEFEQDLLVIEHAVQLFGLPDNLKLSIHSGSDKFSLYPIMGRLIKKHDSGIHLKTAGTTWLEEVTGLAMAGGEALRLTKKIYAEAHSRLDELRAPYAAVTEIDAAALPLPDEVEGWSGEIFAGTLRHLPDYPGYDPGFRQLIHVGYKVAAEMGGEFRSMLVKHRDVVEEQVTANLFDRHIRRLFDIR